MESPYDLVLKSTLAALAIGMLIPVVSRAGTTGRKVKVTGLRASTPSSLIGLLGGVSALVSCQITPGLSWQGSWRRLCLIIAAPHSGISANKM